MMTEHMTVDRLKHPLHAMTTYELRYYRHQLERVRRELRAGVALARPGSPACAPMVAQLNAVEAELARRGAS
jgi:hypothetical protein